MNPVVVRSEMWFDDGNIVLQTGKGTPDVPLTQFRVYKGLLAVKSSVFRDMFVVAGPDTGQMVDECPVVQLDDDRHELEHVLRALHMDTSYYDLETPMAFPAIAGFVRLGRKYDIPELRKCGLSRLHVDFPNQLYDYACGQDGWNAIADTDDVDVVKAARLLVDCNVSVCLPAAFLQMASMELSWLMSGNPSRLSTLSPDILATFLLGRERILSKQMMYHFDWASSAYHPPTCVSRRKCMEVKLKIVFEAHEYFDNTALSLNEWHNLGGTSCGVDELCTICRLAGNERYMSQMNRFWDGLPSLFDLPPWQTLLKDANECKH